MTRHIGTVARSRLRQLLHEQKGIAELLLVAMFAFILAVILTGHRIVVQ